jgi:hypothetical protein
LVELGATIPGGNMVVDRLRVEIRLFAGERLVLNLGLPAYGDRQFPTNDKAPYLVIKLLSYQFGTVTLWRTWLEWLLSGGRTEK